MQVGAVVLLCVGAYALAGIPSGMLLVRLRHPDLDLRAVGTGNVGTSNIFRNVGLGTAAVVGPLQFAQGVVPVLAGRALGLSEEGLVAAAVCAVAGSGFSPYLRFRGGRAVAVATGAVAALGIAGLVTLLACYAAGLVAGEIAAGVIAGFTVLPVVEAATAGFAACAGAVLILGLVVIRRLDGVQTDLCGPGAVPALLGRLLRDRRPGQRLVGPRDRG